MPITTLQYTNLLSAAQQSLSSLHRLAIAADSAAMLIRHGDWESAAQALITAIDAAKPSRATQIEVELATRIYTPAKIARNERKREYMNRRNGRQTEPLISPSAPHEETEDERNARLSREEDEAADSQFSARIVPTRSLDISAPPREHEPLPPPQTGEEIRKAVVAKLNRKGESN